MAEVRWTENALDDLRAICSFIARDSEHVAIATATRIFLATDRLADHPDSGRVVPERERADLREIVVKPHRVVYRRLSDGTCEIIAVIHGKQTLPAGVQEATATYGDDRSWKLPTFGNGGLLPGVDLDNSADLLDRMTTGPGAA